MKRCQWKTLETNPIYQTYHDEEWGVPSYDDRYLFEMFVLESFHTGLSWLIILKKREQFRLAFDQFDPTIIKDYQQEKIEELLQNKHIVRNKLKINATIKNANAFLDVVLEFGSFHNYIWSFTNHKIIYGDGITQHTKTPLSDTISKDLKQRGFSFMGSVTTYSYLQAIGIVNDHEKDCYKFHKNKGE